MTNLVHVNQWKGDHKTQEQNKKAIEDAKQVGWKNFSHDLPVPFDLGEFMNELKKLMPNIEFIPVGWTIEHKQIKDEQGNFVRHDSFRVFNEVAVYLKEFPFDIGRINFKDNSVSGGSEHTYGVYSRKIKNAKFGQYRNQFNMITCKDLKKALKNAQKYLMPYSVKELAQAFYEPLRDNVNKEVSQVRSNIDNLAHNIRYRAETIAREILHLKRAGVKFISPEFNEIADKVEDVMAEFDAENSRKVSALFARIYKVGEESYVTLQEVADVKGMHEVKDGTTIGYKASELPQDIVNAISVLSILTDGQYVKDVGMRMDAEHFWIQRSI